MRSVECASCIARQIVRGKRAATADTRVLAPALSQVQDRLQTGACKWVRCVVTCGANGAHQWYGGAHGGLYETLTSLVYFALLATPLPATDPGAPRAMLSGARTCLTCLTLCSPPAAYLQPSPTSHSASLMPSILCRSSAPLSSAVLPIRYAPIRFRFEQDVCSCERSNLMTIL